MLPKDVLKDIDDWMTESEKIDLIMVIGTSSKVYPAAGFVDSARAKGARVAVINMDSNDMPASGLYKEDIQNDCCGDSMLGWALHDRAKVDISGLWPMFNPHGLHGIPFGPLYWCEPVISLHKTHPSDFEKLWNWENSRDRTKGPLLHRDLIDFHKLGEFETREDWDNADWDGFNEESTNHTSNQSFESCREYCTSVPHCYQFTWHAHHCWMTKGIRLGHAKDPDGYHEEVDRKYVSGWVTEKIKKWVDENKCEEGAHWVKPSVKRKF